MRIDRKTRRRLLSLGVASLLPVVAACSGDGANSEKSPAPEAIKPEIVPPLPVQVAPLDRARLLVAFAAAADATASGAAPPEANKALVGRSFELRLPFGCDGPGKDEWANWTFDERRKILKLDARTEKWTGTELARQLVPDHDHDVVEGFWLGRAWTSSESCPPSPVAANEAGDDATDQALPAPTPESAGIAQFLTADASRRLQLGRRPFLLSRKVENDPAMAGKGFSLVLKGRVQAYPDGQPVRCWSPSARLRPTCLLSVEFSGIAFEDANSREMLADWQF